MAVKQQDLGLNLNKRRTRKAVLLDEKNLAAPCSGLLALISPHAPRAKTGRAPFELETMLRIHFVRQWFGLSEPAMPEALFETALYRGFVGLSSVERIPERVSILRLRRLLKGHQPAEQILAAVNATLTGKGLMFREGTAVDAALMCLPMRFTRVWPSAKIRKASLPSGMWSCARVSLCAGQEHAHGCHPAQAGAGQGAYPGQGGTPILVTLFALSNRWMARRSLLQGLQK